MIKLCTLKFLRQSTLFIPVLALGSCMTTPGAVSNWAVTSSSDESIILMDSPNRPYPVTLSFSKDGSTGFMSRVYVVVAPANYDKAYVGRTLKPGEYMLTALVQQGTWQTCFQNGTVKFNVEPGRVYYLGRPNWDEMLRDLQQSAADRGMAAAPTGSVRTGWTPNTRPQFTLPSDQDTEAVSAFVKNVMPETSAKLELLPTEEITFDVSETEQAIQVCG